MAYIVNRFNGTQLTVVEDGTIDQTTDIKFVGRNYSGYGEVQNENYLHLLENFSGTTAPVKALDGQVWYDASTTKLKFYTGSAWKTAGGTEVSASEPVGLDEGDLWWSSTSNQLYGKTAGGEFILVGPQSAGSGTTQMLSVNVLSAPDNIEKTIIVALINDVAIYVISNEEFTLATTQPSGTPVLTGFNTIKRGITFVNTGSTGVTVNAEDNDVSGLANEPIYWGTVSNSLKLGGFSADDFIGAGNLSFKDPQAGVSQVFFGDEGITIGGSNDLILKIATDGTTPLIQNGIGDKIVFGATENLGGSPVNIVSIRNVSGEIAGIYPETTSVYNIGSETARFAEVHAVTFNGNATKASTVDVGGTGRSASTAASANTIAARDSNGDLTARFFNGTATQAQYADLAEKYTTEVEHPVGTVMTVSAQRFVEEADVSSETRPARSSDLAIGVISENPAYLMNADIDGQAIALKGRVPVRCTGIVEKGTPVYAWEDGVCTTTATRALVGIALETNTNPEEKLVECVLKV
jgi:hypothetical protein